MKYNVIATATKVRSEAETEYAAACQRCGVPTGPRWLHRSKDGLHLCQDCRGGKDREWIAMASGESRFRWTTDEELAALDACVIVGPSPQVGRHKWTCTTHQTVCVMKDQSKREGGRGCRKADMVCPMEGMPEVEEEMAS